jgi:O-antigen/teichoic acid export membrane protein
MNKAIGMRKESLLSSNTIANKLVKQSSIAYIFMLLVAPIGYIIRVVASNSLSVEEIGIFYSVVGLIMLLSAYNDLWLTEASRYFLPTYWIKKKYNEFTTTIFLTFIAQIISGLFFGGILFRGADRLAENYFHSPSIGNIIKVFALYFVGVNIIQLLSSIYSAFQDIIAYNSAELVRLRSTLAFTLVFWLTDTLNITNLTIAWISWLGWSIITAIIFFLYKYRLPVQTGKIVWNNKQLQSVMRYAFWVFIGANASTILGQIDQQMAIVLLGPTTAGLYSNFYSLLSLYTIPIGPILGIILPLAMEALANKQEKNFNWMQNVIYRYFSIFALSMTGIFMMLWPEIATILYGEKFSYSGTLLYYVAGFIIFHLLLSINRSFMAALDKVKQRVKILLFGAILNLLINFVLVYVYKLGVIGIITGTITGWIVMFWWSMHHIHKFSPINIARKKMFINSFIIGIISIIIINIKDDFFILQDSFRMENVTYMVIIIIVYYSILGLVNYNDIRLITHQIKQWRK